MNPTTIPAPAPLGCPTRHPDTLTDTAVDGDPCPGHPVGPHDDLTVDQVLDLLPRLPVWSAKDTAPARRLRGARRILEWLATHEGAGWQQRWRHSHADQQLDWDGRLFGAGSRHVQTDREELRAGLNWLLLARVVHPGYEFFHHHRTLLAFALAPQVISPVLFARLGCSTMAPAPAQPVAGIPLNPKHLMFVRVVLVKIVLHTGKELDQLTPADLLEFRDTGLRHAGKVTYGLSNAWGLLARVGVLAEGSSLRGAVRLGQRSITERVDAYGIRDATVRSVLLRYFTERQAGLDYTSLSNIIATVAGLFWADIERHHPGIDSLHLPEDVALAWKERLRHVDTGEGPARPRRTYFQVLTTVRAFYLDIAEWAHTDPSWVPYAVASPVRRGDTAGAVKDRHQAVARMHQRTRERLPQLPALVESAGRHRREQAELLAAATAVPGGELFTVGDTTYLRVVGANEARGDRYRSANVLVRDTGTGQQVNLTFAEDQAFWTWAMIEVLRHTGVRLEELLEITHLALVSHRLPKTGEIVPLLQIVPSKTNRERLLLVSPELASVLATIISRTRACNGGAIPLVSRYDHHERLTGPALPHLFGRNSAGRPHAVPNPSFVARMLNDAVARCGLRDAAGDRLTYTAHDFRRIFTTEAVDSGLPLHIVARVLGHANINVTQGYHAVFDEVLISAYRGFLNTRRELRPQGEYREPTDAEWAEFEQHFELRKLELGTCGRPYGTPCQHEHACIRCPMLRVDPRQRARLAEIAHNLTERISEARVNGWHGEIAGLQISLDAAKRKLAALEPATGPTSLGLPTLRTPPPPAAAKGGARR